MAMWKTTLRQFIQSCYNSVQRCWFHEICKVLSTQGTQALSTGIVGHCFQHSCSVWGSFRSMETDHLHNLQNLQSLPRENKNSPNPPYPLILFPDIKSETDIKKVFIFSFLYNLFACFFLINLKL